MNKDHDSADGAARRLTSGIEPPEHREILTRCLTGSVSPAVALMQLLIDTEDVSAVRTTIDHLAVRAAALSRATDSLLRDRVDDLTQLMVENELGCERIAEMLRSNMDSPEMAPTVEAGIAFCERLFDWSVQQSEEASVALYSLGNPTLLETATNEIVAQLEQWNVLGTGKSVLDLGCGIGRIAAAISPKVREVHGIDVSRGMIDIALRRCEPLTNVHLQKSTGHDLREFGDAAFDTIISVDTFPYINQSGPPLVESHFGEAKRTLKPKGDFVILNYSYRGDDDADKADVKRLATEYGFEVLVLGEHPFNVWNGAAFRLRKAEADRV